MATLYVSSVDGNDTTPPSVTWWGGNQATYATVTGALLAATDTTNIIYVDSAHSHTANAAISWDVPNANTSAAIICVNRSTGAWIIGAEEKVGAFDAAFGIALANRVQNLFIYGITCWGGSSVSTTSIISVASLNSAVFKQVILDKCIFRTASSNIGGSGILRLGPTATTAQKIPIIQIRNCTVYCINHASSATAVTLQLGSIEINNLTIGFDGPIQPPAIFMLAYGSTDVVVNNCDFSSYTNASGYLVNFATFFYSGQWTFRNVKLSAQAGLTNNSILASGDNRFILINVDSGDTKTVFEYRDSYGTITQEEAIYVADGAKFPGNIPICWKIVTSETCSEHTPFITPWLTKYNPTATSPITCDVEYVQDSVSDLTNREIWSECDYVSSADFPLGVLNTNRNTQPFAGTPVDRPNSSVDWTVSPAMTNENPQYLRHSITPGEVGLIRARVCIGKASQTLYLNPQLRIATV